MDMTKNGHLEENPQKRKSNYSYEKNIEKN